MGNNNGISTSAFHHNRKDFQITNREHEVLSKTIKESTEKELLGQICYELIRVRMNTAATAELLKVTPCSSGRKQSKPDSIDP